MADMSISSLAADITARMDWNREHIVAEIAAQGEQTRALLRGLFMPTPVESLKAEHDALPVLSVPPCILPEIGKKYVFHAKPMMMSYIGTVVDVDYPWVRLLAQEGGHPLCFTLEEIASYQEIH